MGVRRCQRRAIVARPDASVLCFLIQPTRPDNDFQRKGGKSFFQITIFIVQPNTVMLLAPIDLRQYPTWPIWTCRRRIRANAHPVLGHPCFAVFDPSHTVFPERYSGAGLGSTFKASSRFSVIAGRAGIGVSSSRRARSSYHRRDARSVAASNTPVKAPS
jgi:hypothetical protein